MRSARVSVLAMLLLVACDVPPDDAPAGTPAASEPATRAHDGLDAALAGARAVELPEGSDVIDFAVPDAVFRAADAPSYVETVHATATDSTGARIYWLELATTHLASPPSFHARGTIGGTSELWRLVGATWGLHDRFDVIRMGDEFWTRSPDAWSGPKSADYVMWLSIEGPARLVSGRFGTTQPADSVGHDTIDGRGAAHFRFIDDRTRFDGLWNAITTGLPNEPMPSGVTGTADVWMLQNGLVLRARLDAVAPDGRVFRATLDVHDFGAPVHIQAPVASSTPLPERLP